MISPKYAKPLAIIASCLCAVFAFLYFRTVSLPSGGGQQKVSPNGRFIAEANSLANDNPLARSKEIYGEFLIKRGSDRRILRRVIIDRVETTDVMCFRDLSDLINWNTNSAEVRFSLPGMSMTLSVTNIQ